MGAKRPPCRRCLLSDDVNRAVAAVLDEGWRTGDIKSPDTPDDHVVGTVKMGDLVVERL